MTPPSRLLILAALFVVVAGPGLMAHALLDHLLHARLEPWPRDLRLLGLTALTLGSLLPLGLAMLAVARILAGLRDLRRLTALGRPVSIADAEVLTIPGNRPILCTVGLRTPRILISEGALGALRDDELRAALLHERAHIEAKDTRWLPLIALVAAAWVWLPPARRSLTALRDTIELQADARALASGANRRALFDALLVVAGASAPARTAAGLGDAALERRLQRLAGLGVQAEPRPAGLLAVTVTTLALPLVTHGLLLSEVLCHTDMA